MLCWNFEVLYGYRSEDITVLKDDPGFADHLQPTRENIVSTFFSFSPLDGCARLSGPNLDGADFGFWAGFSCAN
jgi:hypothetical protein